MKTTAIILLLTVCTAIPAFSLLPSRENERGELTPYKADSGAFSNVVHLMDEADIGSRDMEKLFILAYRFDGLNVLGQGDPALLAAARRTLYRLQGYDKRYENGTLIHGIRYLAQKGDARDFPFFDEHLADPELLNFDPPLPPERLFYPYRILQHRVAGTNIISGIIEKNPPGYYGLLEDKYSANWLRFIPSVANTGPQAAYVYKALKQAVFSLGALENDSMYTIITNAAPELLTMRVWFDADGKAVCDVDLAKYGISVPGLGMATNAPPPLEPPPAAADATITAETPVIPQPQPSAAPSARPRPAGLVAVGAGVLAAVLLLATLWRKRLRR